MNNDDVTCTCPERIISQPAPSAPRFTGKLPIGDRLHYGGPVLGRDAATGGDRSVRCKNDVLSSDLSTPTDGGDANDAIGDERRIGRVSSLNDLCRMHELISRSADECRRRRVNENSSCCGEIVRRFVVIAFPETTGRRYPYSAPARTVQRWGPRGLSSRTKSSHDLGLEGHWPWSWP